MANSTALAPRCPAPFLPEARYPSSVGFVPGRFCAPTGNVSCCLPCPQTDWVYPDNFMSVSRIANWINVVGMACCLFLLVTFAVLPVERTHRHYLSVCLVLSVGLMQLGFIIPLGARPAQCANDVTPNDMYSSVTCALSGATLLMGGWCAVMWVFMRALSLHLQICWQMVTGRKYFVAAQLIGWGLPTIFVASSLAITGVSFRFGDTCHINHSHALATFWAPLLTCAAASIVVQFTTFGYCIKVYLQSLMEERSSTTNHSGLPSYNGSVRTATAAQASRRVRRVIRLQWRGIAIVLLIIVDSVFFSVVFVYLDSTLRTSVRLEPKGAAWLMCLLAHPHDRHACLSLAHKIVLSEATVISILILLSMNGIWCLILLTRRSMLEAWADYGRQKLWLWRHGRAGEEFVSIDARRRYSTSGRASASASASGPGSAAGGAGASGATDLGAKQKEYEMLHSPSSPPKPKPRKPLLRTAAPAPVPPASPPTITSPPPPPPPPPVPASSSLTGPEARYTQPTQSFSAPRPPSSSPPPPMRPPRPGRREWDPEATYAPSSMLPPLAPGSGSPPPPA